MNNEKGFSLVELLVTIAILSIVVVGVMKVFIYATSLSEIARNQTIAVSEAKSKIEEMRNYTFSSLAADYGSGGTPGNTFDLTEIIGKGVVYIDSSNANLLEIKVVVSWQNQDGRVVGEDKDLDGVLDTGEDSDGNGQLSSLVEIVSLIAKR